MSTKQASAYLGVNLRTLYRFIDEGGLPAFKFGRVIRLRQQDVEAFVESARIVPGSLEHLYPEPTRQAGR
jgi:excisionase family DNA binding protein